MIWEPLLNLWNYIRSIKSNKRDIISYQKFLISDYVMSLIIINHRNIEICCKKDNWLSQIYDNITILSKFIDIQTQKY